MKLRTKAAVAVGSLAVLFHGTVPVSAADATCSLCGPGSHWIDSCSAGMDGISAQSALVGIDNSSPLDCVADISLVLNSCGTDFIINRMAPSGHTIDTEIVDLCLTNGTQTMVAGAGMGQGGVLAASSGMIVERVADDTIGDSTFGVMFEFDLGGGVFVYNHTPLAISSGINCVPPRAEYLHPTGCTPLFDSPIIGQGTLIANLVSANHSVGPVPTVSEWSLIIMTVLAFTAGTILFSRRRRAAAA